MKPQFNPTRAFTLIELLVVISIIAILMGFLLTSLARSKARAHQAACTSNLRQVGLGFNLFAMDNFNRLPMQLSAHDGGTKEFVDLGVPIVERCAVAPIHFQALSNQIVTPKILTCPSDKKEVAASFSSFSSNNLSYFVEIGSTLQGHGDLVFILAGDRNSRIVRDRPHSRPDVRVVEFNWTRELHSKKGNILCTDTHVELSRNGGRRFLPTKPVEPEEPSPQPAKRIPARTNTTISFSSAPNMAPQDAQGTFDATNLPIKSTTIKSNKATKASFTPKRKTMLREMYQTAFVDLDMGAWWWILVLLLLLLLRQLQKKYRRRSENDLTR